MTDTTKTQDDSPMMDKLRAACRGAHAKIDSLPFFKALMAHQLPLASYVGQLRALSIIHGVMEQELSTSTDPSVLQVWEERLRKLPWLQADLRFFEPRQLPEVPEATEAALRITETIRLCSATAPYRLLGCLYVMEGTTLGNDMHRPDVVQTFQLQNLEGYRYFHNYGDSVREQWQVFTKRMNTALSDKPQHGAVIETALQMFEELGPVFNRLYPLEMKPVTLHVTRINPEAGHHPIPDSEVEIQAALKASTRVWAEFPYYEFRYGERGKRFSDSDICWLVTLTALPPEDLQRQIDWLNRVLANRGMPSIMLERTLRVLHEELVAVSPECCDSYDKLLPVADNLHRTRNEYVADETVLRLCQKFHQEIGPELTERHSDAGLLLACAAADTHNGIDNALPSLLASLADEQHFPDEWINAVRAIVERLNEERKRAGDG